MTAPPNENPRFEAGGGVVQVTGLPPNNTPKRGRGKAHKTIALIDAAIRILEEIQPASIRAVCYRLFVEKLIPSMNKANTNMVSRQLVYAREQGDLPWEWVVDETREAMDWATYKDPVAFLDTVRDNYSRDAWQDQPNWVEVWSEKSTVKGALMPVLDKYAVTFRSFHGHTSATAIHGVCQETRQRRRKLIALYCGDWDPSGLHMSEIDLPERIGRYGGDIDLRRIAISRFDTHPGEGIPHFNPAEKKTDPRYKWFMQNYRTKCFELDALSPRVLRERVDAEIENLLDIDAWNHANAIGRAELESIRGYFDSWPGISMPANKYSGGAS